MLSNSDLAKREMLVCVNRSFILNVITPLQILWTPNKKLKHIKLRYMQIKMQAYNKKQLLKTCDVCFPLKIAMYTKGLATIII
jgi:hypothetical protein